MRKQIVCLFHTSTSKQNKTIKPTKHKKQSLGTQSHPHNNVKKSVVCVMKTKRQLTFFAQPHPHTCMICCQKQRLPRSQINVKKEVTYVMITKPWETVPFTQLRKQERGICCENKDIALYTQHKVKRNVECVTKNKRETLLTHSCTKMSVECIAKTKRQLYSHCTTSLECRDIL